VAQRSAALTAIFLGGAAVHRCVNGERFEFVHGREGAVGKSNDRQGYEFHSCRHHRKIIAALAAEGNLDQRKT